jgi:glycosyltransferase involved in cell wall biosynthesis
VETREHLPLVSIITPTYNHERYIGACIASVQAQTYPSWELIVVDDDSNDSTWQIVQRYATGDPRIRAFRQTHKGIWRLAETYNFALAQARGELIAILEGDDYWPDSKLAIQSAWHRAYPAAMLSYGTYMHAHTGYELPGQAPSRFGHISGLDWFKMQAMRVSGIIAASVVISRSALLQVGGFIQWERYPAVDNPTYFALARLPHAYFYVGSELVSYWRHHEGQTTGDKGYVLAEMNMVKTLEFFSSLSTQEQRALALTEPDIWSARLPGLSDAYFSAVRLALTRHDKAAARQLAGMLWRYGNLKRKIQAAYARCALSLGWDMEPILALCEPFSVKGAQRRKA